MQTGRAPFLVSVRPWLRVLAPTRRYAKGMPPLIRKHSPTRLRAGARGLAYCRRKELG